MTVCGGQVWHSVGQVLGLARGRPATHRLAEQTPRQAWLPGASDKLAGDVSVGEKLASDKLASDKLASDRLTSGQAHHQGWKQACQAPDEVAGRQLSGCSRPGPRRVPKQRGAQHLGDLPPQRLRAACKGERRGAGRARRGWGGVRGGGRRPTRAAQLHSSPGAATLLFRSS